MQLCIFKGIRIACCFNKFLKKIIKIQIDAGVQGIQLDECELPMTSMGVGGCFCKDCMREFTEYLIEQKARGKLSSEWDDIDVANFNYKEYLKTINVYGTCKSNAKEIEITGKNKESKINTYIFKWRMKIKNNLSNLDNQPFPKSNDINIEMPVDKSENIRKNIHKFLDTLSIFKV